MKTVCALTPDLWVGRLAGGGTGPGDLEHTTGRAVEVLTALRVRERLVTPRGCPVGGMDLPGAPP